MEFFTENVYNRKKKFPKGGNTMQITTFAGIDIGSYEVGMKIFELSAKYGMKEITYIRRRLDLGKYAYTTGRIAPGVVDELCEVLIDFTNIMKEYQVTDCRACVTSAIREADNALIILDHIKVRTGIVVEALSNSEQRFLGYKSIAYQGTAFEKMIQKGTAIFDIGGGSIQLSLFDKDKLVTTQNIRMGIIRIRERLSGLEDRSAYQIAMIEDLVNNEINSFKKMYIKDREIRSAILVGDYINYVVRRFRKKDNNEFVTKEELLENFDWLMKLSPRQMAKELGIPAENESLILPAIVIYRRLILDIQPELIWAPGLNLSDGLAYDYAEQHKIMKSSHNFENDILAAAKNIAKRYQSDRPHINVVDSLALTVFDAVKRAAGLGDRDRLLLDIAVQLHHCGKFITISRAAECNYNIIMSTEIIGLSHKERNLIANIVRFVTTDFPGFDELAAKEDIEEESYLKIAKLVAIVRVANALDRSHRQKIKEMRASLKGSRLLLNVDTSEDITLEKGLFPDKAEFFAEVFGIVPEIRQKKKLK